MAQQQWGEAKAQVCCGCGGLWVECGQDCRFLVDAAQDAEKKTTHRMRDALAMKCPACRKPLQKARTHGEYQRIVVQFCPDCKAMFLEGVDFKLLKKRKTLASKEPEGTVGRPVSSIKENLEKEHQKLLRGEITSDEYYEKFAEDRDLGVKEYLFNFLTGLPIEINVPPQKPPLVTYALLAINVVVFLIIGVNLTREVASVWGLVPAHAQLYAFFTSMFMHAGIGHIVGNMYFLYVFGDNVEDRLGSKAYLAFYLICGLVAGLVYIIIQHGSTMPVVGASGAISGILGAYLLACPKAKIGIVFFFYPLKIPAWGYFLVWVAFQFILSAVETNVAWQAHLGGFFCGLILYPIFKNTIVKWNEAAAA
jgi:membrane associated rhomboid family serine protease